MGFFSEIKDKISSAYNKVDSKLGGYLPGGSTPSEVKASKTAAVAPTTTAPATSATKQPTSTATPAFTGAQPQSIAEGVTSSPAATSSKYTGSSSDTSEYKKTSTGLLEKDGKTYTEIDGEILPVSTGVAGGLVSPAGGASGAASLITKIIAKTKGLKTATTAVKANSLIKTATTARKTAESIAAADRTGAAIATTNKIVNVGDKLATGSGTIKNSVEATKYSNAVINAAKQSSPNNWQRILGFFKNNSKKLVGLGSAAFLSELVSVNFIGDNIDRLGFAADTVAKNGDIDGANELFDLQEEAVDFAQSVSSYIPFYQIIPSASNFFKDQRTANELKRDSINKEYEKDSLIDDIALKIAEGSATDEEKDILRELDPDNYDLLNDIRNQPGESRVDAEGNYIPNAEEIARQAYYDGETTVEGDAYTPATIEPSSTLGFGLLNTGTEYKEEDLLQQPTGEQVSLEQQAMDIFGIPYAQLSEAQKASLQ